MSVSAFEAFDLYMAIKLHFGSKSYNAVKYNFKTSVKKETFWKRKDKYFYEKLGKRFDRDALINYYVAHFSNKPDVWVGDMINQEDVFTEWKKRNGARSYNFQNDLAFCINTYGTTSLNLLLNNRDEMYPVMIEALMSEEIAIESVVIMNRLVGFISRVKTADTIVWPDLKKKLEKYDPFIQFERAKYADLVKAQFSS